MPGGAGGGSSSYLCGGAGPKLGSMSLYCKPPIWNSVDTTLPREAFNPTLSAALIRSVADSLTAGGGAEEAAVRRRPGAA